jgi:hypothetical protein
MQSVILKIDESINLIDFVKKVQTIYGKKQVEPVLVDQPSDKSSKKRFGVLPDIFTNPIIINDFHMYSREELNER